MFVVSYGVCRWSRDSLVGFMLRSMRLTPAECCMFIRGNFFEIAESVPGNFPQMPRIAYQLQPASNADGEAKSIPYSILNLSTSRSLRFAIHNIMLIGSCSPHLGIQRPSIPSQARHYQVKSKCKSSVGDAALCRIIRLSVCLENVEHG